MGIVHLPEDTPYPSLIHCAICDQDISYEAATAGVHDGRRQQAFACDKHLSERSAFIVGWADYVVAQHEATVSSVDRFEGTDT